MCVLCSETSYTIRTSVGRGLVLPASPCFRAANDFENENDGAHLDRIRMRRAACYYHSLRLPTSPDAPNPVVLVLLDVQLATIICGYIIHIQVVVHVSVLHGVALHVRKHG